MVSGVQPKQSQSNIDSDVYSSNVLFHYCFGPYSNGHRLSVGKP
jgi:hypothetical protein